MNISLGQIAFEAYARAMAGKTYDGNSIPHWSDVSPQERAGWEAAAQAVQILPKMQKLNKRFPYDPERYPHHTGCMCEECQKAN